MGVKTSHVFTPIKRCLKIVNDITIAAGILFFFVLAGAIMPFIYEDFNFISTTLDSEAITDDMLEEAETTGDLSPSDFMKSILSMIFWLPSFIPFWLKSVFYIFRIILVFIIARNIWIGGGG